MENRGSKAMALAALIVGVVGLTIGFAAFSATLTIDSSAEYTPNASEFTTVFGFAQKTADPEGSGSVAADYAKNWTGINASFDGTGQSKTYTATVKNGSEYDATTSQTTYTLEPTTCEAEDGTTAALKDAACAEISAVVTMPETVAKNNGTTDGTGEATIVITGPTTAVDGKLTVTFPNVEAVYTTAK